MSHNRIQDAERGSHLNEAHDIDNKDDAEGTNSEGETKSIDLDYRRN